MKISKHSVFVLLAVIQIVDGEERIFPKKRLETSLSLEEVALLTDAADLIKKKPEVDNDPAKDSNFQHRLKQVIQTARVAAGSGQSTGSPVLDQTIRQVRARIRASNDGEKVSDTSIFDAALQALGDKGSTLEGTNNQANALVDAIVKNLAPGSAIETTTTNSPASPNLSLVGDLIRKIADRGNPGSASPGGLLDVVVNQLVPTTTTTTTTTPRPPAVLDLLAGLVRTYQGNNQPKINDSTLSGGDVSGGDSQKKVPTQTLISGLQDIFQRLQVSSKLDPEPKKQEPASKPGNTAGGQLTLESITGRLRDLLPPAVGNASQSSDVIQWIRSAIAKKPTMSDSSTGSIDPTPSLGLDGFEGLISDKVTTQASIKTSQLTTEAPTTRTSNAAKFNVQDAKNILSGLLRQFGDSTKTQKA